MAAEGEESVSIENAGQFIRVCFMVDIIHVPVDKQEEQGNQDGQGKNPQKKLNLQMQKVIVGGLIQMIAADIQHMKHTLKKIKRNGKGTDQGQSQNQCR